MAGQVFFKTAAFGGFQKEDVLQYIDHLNRQSDENQRQLEEQLDGIEKELSACKASLEQAQQENSDLSAKLSEAAESEKQAAEKCDRLYKELLTYQKEADQKDREIQIQADLSRQLSDKLVRLEEQLSQTEQARSSQQAAVKQSELEAAQLLSNAQSQADKLVEGARQTVDRVGANMSQLHRELDELRSFVKSALAAMEQQIDAIDQAASTADGFCTLEVPKTPSLPEVSGTLPEVSGILPESSPSAGQSTAEEKSAEGTTFPQIPAISITLYNTPGVKKGTVHFTNQCAKSNNSCPKGKVAASKSSGSLSPFRELLNTIDLLILNRSRG